MASTTKSTVFRVTGLPCGEAEHDVHSALAHRIRELLSGDEQRRLEVRIACIPSCDERKTSSALVEFKGGDPTFLAQLSRDPLGDWQVEIGDEDINFDRHFFGFTQLYPTAPGSPVTADIIAITGLDGHAYGSWRGKGNLGRMWLRDFLAKDLPHCRTMIYGYNSKLSSQGIDTIMDYGREFLEAIKRVRYTKELRERPLFFIAHSFGGIILAHCLVKAAQANERDHALIAALYKATYSVLFFGTPHKGLVIDDIKRMVAGEEDHPRTDLLEQIKVRSDLLMCQLESFKNIIRDRKIVSFYETQQTKQLEFNPNTQLWARSGPHATAVSLDSAILQLPDDMEVKIPISADHSQIVKFDSKTAETYQTVLGYLKQFEKDACKVVSDRFGPEQEKAPAKSMVPFDRDSRFVGREKILSILEARLSRTGFHSRVALEGLGGAGKSQIAIEYSHRLRQQHPHTWIFWVHADSAVKFQQAYRSIAAAVQIPGWDDSKADILSLVSRWLSNVDNGRWLMILDNADDIDLLRNTLEESSQNDMSHQRTPLAAYIPQTSNGSVLVTTRDRKVGIWLSGAFESVISIKEMDRNEAMQLLRTKIPASMCNEHELEELASELGHLPLAITQAAAFINARANRMTASKYLSLYRHGEANQSRLLDEDFGDLRRDQGVSNSVIRTWHISFDRIKKSHPRAADLLSLMAMFDRQDIPQFLLDTAYCNPLDFEDALFPLDEFSLITIVKGGQSFEMHRLVQIATRTWLERGSEIQKWQGEAMMMLSNKFPNGNPENWATCQVLLPHAREVLKIRLASDDHLLARGTLLHNMAWYNCGHGLYAVAKQQAQESLAINERILHGSQVEISKSLDLLGIVLTYQGKYGEAEAKHRRALASSEEMLGPKHPDTLKSLGSLANALQNQGKCQEAEAMHRRALASREEMLGPKHPDTLKSLGNLANALQNQGKCQEAEAMHRRALASREEILGPKHPDTFKDLINLASALQKQGKYQEAEAMHQQVLVSSHETLGPKHPDTLVSLNNLANVLRDQGNYKEAEAMHRQALSSREATLGLKHPDTLTSLNNLANVFWDQGKYQEAEAMYRQALASREEILGPKHANTLTSLNSLATVLRNQGKYQEAEAMYRQVLASREATLGLKHANTLTSLNSLATVLRNQGKYQEAEAMYRQVLASREATLGLKHPDTLTSIFFLAYLLYKQKKYAEAAPLYERVCHGFQEMLGNDHPRTIACLRYYSLLVEERDNLNRMEI